MFLRHTLCWKERSIIKVLWVYKAYYNKHKSNFIRVVMLINDKCNIKIPDEHKKNNGIHK